MRKKIDIHTMTAPACIACQQPINMCPVQRFNQSFTGICRTCALNYQTRVIDGQFHIINIQKRFAHHGTTWHLTYRPATNETTFVKVVRLENLKEVRPAREEHILPTFVTHTRFLNLLAFL